MTNPIDGNWYENDRVRVNRREGGMEKKETSLRNHKETSGPQWDHCDLITINSGAYDKKVGTGCA